MNKSYRSIWNEALGAWVAVSEVESAKGKKSTGRVRAKEPNGHSFALSRVAVACTTALLLSSGADSSFAQASGTFNYFFINNANDSGCGYFLEASGNTLVPDSRCNSMSTSSTDMLLSAGQLAVSGNYSTYQSPAGIQFSGTGAPTSIFGFNVLNNGAYIRGTSIVNGSLRAGSSLTGTSTTSDIFNSDYFRVTSSGPAASATGTNAIALGQGATASGLNSSALTNSSTASGDYATAIGGGSVAAGNYSVAFGQNAGLAGSAISSVAIGVNSSSAGTSSVAVGDSAAASCEESRGSFVIS